MKSDTGIVFCLEWLCTVDNICMLQFTSFSACFPTQLVMQNKIGIKNSHLNPVHKWAGLSYTIHLPTLGSSLVRFSLSGRG